MTQQQENASEQLYGMCFHHYTYLKINLPAEETPNTITDMCVKHVERIKKHLVKQHGSFNSKQCQALIVQIVEIGHGIEKLSAIFANKYKPIATDTNASSSTMQIGTFNFEFRGLLMSALHYLYDLTYCVKRPQSKKFKLMAAKAPFFVTAFQFALVLAKNKEKCNLFALPYSEDVKIDKYVDLEALNLIPFYQDLGSQFSVDFTSFLETIIPITAAQELVEYSTAKQGLARFIKFGLKFIYFYIAEGDAAHKADDFFRNNTVEKSKRVWDFQNTGFVYPFLHFGLPHVAIAKEFVIPAFDPVELDKTYTARIAAWQDEAAKDSGTVTPNGNLTLSSFLKAVAKVPKMLANFKNQFIRCRFISHLSNKEGCCVGEVATARTDATNGSLIMHYHGGGFIAMSSFAHETYLRRWAVDSNIPIVSVDYTLAPAAMFPTQIEECFAAYKWVVQNATKFLPKGETLKKIILAGDSAGGNLALTVAIRAAFEGIRMPDALVLSYPSLYLRADPCPSRMLAITEPLVNMAMLESTINAYIPKEMQKIANLDPLASPIVSPDFFLKMLPATLITTGSLDPLFDDSIALAKTLQRLTGKVKLNVQDGYSHGFLSFVSATTPEFLVSTKRIIRWVELFLNKENK